MARTATRFLSALAALIGGVAVGVLGARWTGDSDTAFVFSVLALPTGFLLGIGACYWIDLAGAIPHFVSGGRWARETRVDGEIVPAGAWGVPRDLRFDRRARRPARGVRARWTRPAHRLRRLRDRRHYVGSDAPLPRRAWPAGGPGARLSGPAATTPLGRDRRPAARFERNLHFRVTGPCDWPGRRRAGRLRDMRAGRRNAVVRIDRTRQRKRLRAWRRA